MGGEVAVNTVTEETWNGVAEVLRTAGEVCLAAHVNPDGDSLGSAIALAIALRSMGKNVYISFGDEPFVVPDSLEFLPSLDSLVPPEEFPSSPQVLVVLDTASRERLGVIADRLDKAQTVIVIDHHVTNDGFGTYNLIDTEAAATAVITERLLERLGIALTRDVATALYAGIASDTGSFKYRTTTPATHRLAAKLLAAGVMPDVVGHYLWDKASVQYLKLLAVVLGGVQLDVNAADGRGLVWATVSREDRRTFEISFSMTEGVIDLVRKASEAEVVAVLREHDSGGVYQVSMRSNGTLDVGGVCTSLGGGGHRYAAGFTSHLDEFDTVARIKDALSKEPDDNSGH